MRKILLVVFCSVLLLSARSCNNEPEYIIPEDPNKEQEKPDDN